jgi:hypothetical protein
MEKQLLFKAYPNGPIWEIPDKTLGLRKKAHQTKLVQITGRDRLVHVARAGIPPGSVTVGREGPRTGVIQAAPDQFAGTGPIPLPLPP